MKRELFSLNHHTFIPHAAALIPALTRLCGEFNFRHTRLKLRIATLSLSITFSACATQSPVDKLKEALRSERSWAATLRMIAESRSGGALPKAYTRKALENIEQELQTEGERLDESKIPAEERAKARGHIESLRESAGEIRRAVEQGDAGLWAQQLDKLKAEEQLIRQSLSESIGEPVP